MAMMGSPGCNSTRELAGRVLTVGLPGPRLDRATRRELVRLAPGGILLFRRNIEDAAQLTHLSAALHALPARPLIGIDHEGGRVLRLATPFTQFPPAADVGRLGVRIAHAVGRAMGVELASLGIDINYAPILDVPRPGASDAIGDRAFATAPHRAAALAVAFLRGLQRGGVLPCGKHFPGHGGAEADSHLSLPVVRRSRLALARTELVPFRAAIAAAVPMLMTAHVRYPGLDARRCATLSPTILRRLLRDTLHFTGVVVSDDLAMRAISDRLTAPSAGAAALAAGVDWLLVCHDLGVARRVADRLVDAAQRSARAAARLLDAARRIRQLPRRAEDRPSRLPLPVAAHLALAERIYRVAAAARTC
ncbi:MAG: beta-N-acetylhexosaminidase [bacterium]